MVIFAGVQKKLKIYYMQNIVVKKKLHYNFIC